MLYRFLFLFFKQALGDFDLVQIRRIEDFACTEHLVDTGKDHHGDGDDCPFFPLLFEIRSYFIQKYEDFLETTVACATWTKAGLR